MRTIICLLTLPLIAGCSQIADVTSGLRGAPAEPMLQGPEPPVTEDVAEDVAEEAAVPETAPDFPAETLATLGNAAEPGLWLKTPLVSVEGPGRVTAVATGTSVDVTLLPIDGPPTAGSRASLAALQALGVPLTAIAPLRVEPL